MKIVLWVGNEPNQMALAQKIHAQFPISGIVTESKKIKSKITILKLSEKIIEKLFLGSISKSWFGMLDFYKKTYPAWPDVELIDVENINSEETLKFTSKINPDLIIVSGTRLIKERLLSLKPEIGILNLHTGLSPYIKGGPNCTNWCIATEQFHLIGNTIMWINKGIDTGNIITTELTDFTGTETLPEVHIKVMEQGHDLYLKAITFLASGKRQNVPQNSITNGITYYSRQWGLKEKIKLIKNFASFKKSINTTDYIKSRSEIKTVKLEVK